MNAYFCQNIHPKMKHKMKKIVLICLLTSIVSCKNISKDEDAAVAVDTTTIASDTLNRAIDPAIRNGSIIIMNNHRD